MKSDIKFEKRHTPQKKPFKDSLLKEQKTFLLNTNNVIQKFQIKAQFSSGLKPLRTRRFFFTHRENDFKDKNVIN